TGAEQIWLHAQKDLELLTLNDRTETIRRDSHLAIERHRLGEIHGDDHLTVHGQRHTQVKGDDHLRVDQTRHEHYGTAQLVEAGEEVHHQAGTQVVVEAGAELTLAAGGSFIKLDGSGVTIVGSQVRINSGGSPGRGRSQAVVLPRLPGEADPETSEDVTLEPHQTPLLESEIVAATPLDLDAVDIADGLADRCSACAPAVGSPVNPLLGAKLLPAETDIALPAPRPFVFSRGYLSCNARIGVLGQGWSVPGEGLSLTLNDTACVIHDAQGRDITFGPLAPGQARHSPTEQLWIRRGGSLPEEAAEPTAAQDDVRWASVPESLRTDPERIVLSDASGLYYVFAPSVSAENGDSPSGKWQLIQERDRNGYATTYTWEADLLVRVEDSAGRHYRFDYDALLPEREADRGQRLMGVKLIQEHDGSAQDEWLVRYSYS
ncbi:DUF6531 domain-containing protein, partial [Halomonas pacifica]|uniref:bacteriophage T4 gp5 trimerisation domain-containing protein n=2 Tax=Bisbaumannia pacifica TaxID=77098 RepID=UPI002359236D